MTDKEVLYSMLEREIRNLTSRNPMTAMFSGTIVNYVLNFIDPYVNAFLSEPPAAKLDADQLSQFATEEVQDKILKFKEQYKRKVQEQK